MLMPSHLCQNHFIPWGNLTFSTFSFLWGKHRTWFDLMRVKPAVALFCSMLFIVNFKKILLITNCNSIFALSIIFILLNLGDCKTCAGDKGQNRIYALFWDFQQSFAVFKILLLTEATQCNLTCIAGRQMQWFGKKKRPPRAHIGLGSTIGCSPCQPGDQAFLMRLPDLSTAGNRALST